MSSCITFVFCASVQIQHVSTVILLHPVALCNLT
jgi:hypothetical protein